MASNVLDSVLFRDSFGTPEMRASSMIGNSSVSM